MKEKNIIDETDSEFETIEEEMEYNRIETAELIDLETAIKKIPPRYQLIIDLYFRQGFSYLEIAVLVLLLLPMRGFTPQAAHRH